MGPPPSPPSKSIQSPACSPVSAITQEPFLRGASPRILASRHSSPTRRPFGKCRGTQCSAVARSRATISSRSNRSAGRAGSTSLRSSIGASIEQHETALGAGNGGIEPAGAIFGSAAKTVVVDNDILPLRALRLVAGDGPAPDRFDDGLFLPVVAALALRIRRHVVVEVAFVDPKALARAVRAADLLPVLGGDDGGDRNLVLVLHLGEVEEHTVDEAEIVAVLQAD